MSVLLITALVTHAASQLRTLQGCRLCPDGANVGGLHASSHLQGQSCMRSTWTPPTVAGPRRILLCLRAYAISLLVSASGTPSAMTATTRMVGCFMASMLDSYALHKRCFCLWPYAGSMLLLFWLSTSMTVSLGCCTALMLCTEGTAPHGMSTITICKDCGTRKVCSCDCNRAEGMNILFKYVGYRKVSGTTVPSPQRWSYAQENEQHSSKITERIKHLLKDAKLMKTSAPGYAFAASGTLPCRGIATSSRPKKTFWKPPGFPGCTTQATEGVSRPARHNLRC